MTPEFLKKAVSISPRKLYPLYLKQQGLYKEWFQEILHSWNQKILLLFKILTPLIVFTIVILTFQTAADGTNDSFIMQELVQEMNLKVPKFLQAYEDVNKLAGGIKRTGYITRDDKAFVYAFLITKYSRQYGFDPALVTGLIEHESQFNPHAISSAKAKGLMQVHQPTWHMSDKDLFDIEKNIEKGVKILFMFKNSNPDSYLKRYGGFADLNKKEANDYVRSVQINSKKIKSFTDGVSTTEKGRGSKTPRNLYERLGN